MLNVNIMGIEKKVLGMRLDEEVIEKLKELAEKENRTVSNLVETIIKKHIGMVK
jgi:predicted DNA-binding protein